MKFAKWASVAIAGAMTMAAPGARAVVVLDQLSYAPAPPPSPPDVLVSFGTFVGYHSSSYPFPFRSGPYSVVQTVTAGKAGNLSSIAVSSYSPYRFDPNGLLDPVGILLLSLIDGDYATGARSVVGQVQVDLASLPRSASLANGLNYVFDVSHLNYMVNNGKKFSLLFETTPQTTGTAALNHSYGVSTNIYKMNYDSGELIQFNQGIAYESLGGGLDLAFATYVDTSGGVPEPVTWALMILGFGGIGAAMRRRGGRTATLAA